MSQGSTPQPRLNPPSRRMEIWSCVAFGARVMWCQRAMFAALLRPLSVAVALHMHVSRTAVVHDHNFVDVPVTVEEEDRCYCPHASFLSDVDFCSQWSLPDDSLLALPPQHPTLQARRGRWRLANARMALVANAVLCDGGSFSPVRICHNRRSHGTAAGVADWEAGLGGTRDRNRLTAIASNPCSDRLEGVPGQE